MLKYDDPKEYLDLMRYSYDDISDEVRVFWEWVMMKLMPVVSSQWRDRVGKNKVKVRRKDPVTGMDVDEHLSHYITSSDLAYVPFCVMVYGKRALENRQKRPGRTAGQKCMLERENVMLYISLLSKMKALFELEQNAANVVEWGNKIFQKLKEEEDQEDRSMRHESSVQRIMRGSQLTIQHDIQRMKMDDMLIPV